MRRLKRAVKTKKPRAICTYEEGEIRCGARSVQTQECLTCEALVKAGKRDEVFTVHYCATHAAAVQGAMNRHVFVSHPSNIPRAMLAALRGEI